MYSGKLQTVQTTKWNYRNKQLQYSALDRYSLSTSTCGAYVTRYDKGNDTNLQSLPVLSADIPQISLVLTRFHNPHSMCVAHSNEISSTHPLHERHSKQQHYFICVDIALCGLVSIAHLVSWPSVIKGDW